MLFLFQKQRLKSITSRLFRIEKDRGALVFGQIVVQLVEKLCGGLPVVPVFALSIKIAGGRNARIGSADIR